MTDEGAAQESRPERPRSTSLPVGVVMRRTPGATRWARWAWRAVALLPGAPPANWRLLREEGETADFLAGALPLKLHRGEIEAYRVSLAMTPPSVFVVFRREANAPEGLRLHAVTASAYEAQDYQDSGEEIVEPVAMPPAVEAWARDFCGPEAPEPFRKRRRGERDPDRAALAGLGDPRVRGASDIYRPPRPGGEEPR